MKEKSSRKVFALLLAALMCVGLFAGCAQQPRSTTPLVVGYSPFSAKFSPFFADTAYDNDAVDMTQVNLLTTDRTGAIVYNAIKGEKIAYNGTDYTYTGIADVDVNYDEAADQTVYTWTIRSNVKFSDGVKLTADDIIFSYYVYSDPSYTGSSTLYSVPILGMQNYRTQTSDEVYVKFADMFDAIYAAGEDHVWSSADSWTQEQQDALWAIVKECWVNDVHDIIDYVFANYISYAPDYIGYTVEDVTDSDDLKIVLGMAMWGYGTVENGVLTAPSGASWNTKNNEYPTVEDYYEETYAAYGGDPEAYAGVESISDTSVIDNAKAKFISTEGPKDPSLGGKGIPNIAGIKKISSTKVEVTVKGFDASAIYKLGINVSPLHYYGDKAKYNYDDNKFGFDFGDLSGIAAKTSQPMGAGPYRFIKYENKVISYEANEYYWRGEP